MRAHPLDSAASTPRRRQSKIRTDARRAQTRCDMTFACIRVRDTRTNVEHVYAVDTVSTFYKRAPVIGRDPSCDIVIDDPEVLPRHVELSAASNHLFVRYLDAGPDAKRVRHDGAK